MPSAAQLSAGAFRSQRHGSAFPVMARGLRWAKVDARTRRDRGRARGRERERQSERASEPQSLVRPLLPGVCQLIVIRKIPVVTSPSNHRLIAWSIQDSGSSSSFVAIYFSDSHEQSREFDSGIQDCTGGKLLRTKPHSSNVPLRRALGATLLLWTRRDQRACCAV